MLCQMATLASGERQICGGVLTYQIKYFITYPRGTFQSETCREIIRWLEVGIKVVV